jgi:DNA-binding PadR family transcriptional regulator
MPDDPQPPLKPQWFQILLALADRELHGTAIMEEVLERTDSKMKLWPGTLYGSLHTLSDRGLICEIETPEDAHDQGGNPRFYAITPQGRQVLRQAVEQMAGWVRAAAAKGVVGDSGWPGPESA